MATLTGALTLGDWAKRVDGNYKVTMITELLSQYNPILQDMLFMEGNLPTGHKTTVRTGIPQGTWRLINAGVPTGKSTTAQLIMTCGNLELFLKVDKDLADLGGNTAAFRETEVVAAIEGLSQQMAQTVLYGNVLVNPERFMGLAPMYNTVSTAAAQNAYNVIDAGGTGGDNTSIWVVVWGPNTLHGIFPKGKTTGLQHQDLGAKWPVTDPAGNQYMAYQDHFKWESGIILKDWRYVIRICNIDVSDLATTTAANLPNLLVRAVNRLPTAPARRTNVQDSDARGISGEMGRTVIYWNRTIQTYFELQAMNRPTLALKLGEYDGMVVDTFRGIPCKPVDAIINNEARVL